MKESRTRRTEVRRDKSLKRDDRHRSGKNRDGKTIHVEMETLVG